MSGRRKRAEHKGFVFQDSDVAKWIEAAAYRLAIKPDKSLERKCDRLIELVASAQHKDGYLDTYYTLSGKKRWTNLIYDHEIYCAGHMIEAGVAYYEVTGKDKLLKVVCRNADLVCNLFGRGKGRVRGYPGHQEIELALFRLYRLTGRERYLEQAKYFIDERGRRYGGKIYFDTEPAARKEETEFRKKIRAEGYWYCQAHAPLRQQGTVEGHAVRAMYMLCGAADVAGQTGDKELLGACKKLWRNLVDKRMYITGGIGSTAAHEGFTRDYDLPNHTAYAETCAAIGLVFWASRMLRIELDGEYADVMERTLYNNVLSSVSLDGKHFFYSNRLACDPRMSFGTSGTGGNIRARRQEWFGCACCPPNLARLLCSLGQYAYSFSDREICVHLYGSSEAKFELSGGVVSIEQRTGYPWRGKVAITVRPDEPVDFTLQLRLPGWCRNPLVKVNGRRISVKANCKKGYFVITRKWRRGDKVSLFLPMQVEMVHSHPAVVENAGRIAIQRGPMVYCLEEVDNEAGPERIVITKGTRFRVKYEKNLLGGCCTILGRGFVVKEPPRGQLYSADDAEYVRSTVKAVPYHLWANRKPGKMAVWIRYHASLRP